MEILDVILQEVRLVRKDLSDHIREEDKTQNEIRQDVHALRTQVALSKQQSNAIVTGISLFVSSLVAWFVAHFGGR
jgi:hypothetical protein